MGGRRGGGGKSWPSPTLENPHKICVLYWEPFCYFFSIWGPFCYVILIMGGLFATLFSILGAFFGLAPPPHPRKFLRAAISIVNPLRISEFLAWFFTIIVIRPDRFNIFECWDGGGGGGGGSEMNVRLCVPFSTYIFCYFTIIVAFCWYQYFHYVCTNSRHMNVESVI